MSYIGDAPWNAILSATWAPAWDAIRCATNVHTRSDVWRVTANSDDIHAAISDAAWDALGVGTWT